MYLKPASVVNRVCVALSIYGLRLVRMHFCTETHQQEQGSSLCPLFPTPAGCLQNTHLSQPSPQGVGLGDPAAVNTEMKRVGRVEEWDGNSTTGTSTVLGPTIFREAVHYTSICSLKKSAVHNGSLSTQRITKIIHIKPHQTDPGSPCRPDPYESDLCACFVSQDCLQITSMQARWVPPWCSLFSIFPVIYHLDIFRSEAEFPNGEFKCVTKVSRKDGLLEPVFKYGQ